MSLSDVAESFGRVSKAAIDMAETSAEKIKHCEAAVESAKEVETIVRDKVNEGFEATFSLGRASYARLDAEINLHLARKSGKQTK